MSTQIRFFGVAAYEIVTSARQHILIDPFLDSLPYTLKQASAVRLPPEVS
jgi:L-ascorbate metabolism protein UlaG (beta-lactamase superfamily)